MARTERARRGDARSAADKYDGEEARPMARHERPTVEERLITSMTSNMRWPVATRAIEIYLHQLFPPA